MPEEINRIVADHVCDWCLAPGERERANLLAEGIDASHIFVVGSTAIDACLRNQPLAQARTILHDLQLRPHRYVLVTLHRAENTTPDVLQGLIQALNDLAQDWTFVFPIHPRTQKVLSQLRQAPTRLALHPNVRLLEPVGYLDMLQLVTHARAVMTDSGGLQEEAATLGTPLMVLRNETEWTYLVESGAAVVVGNSFDAVMDRAPFLLAAGRDAFRQPDMAYQRGAAQRIVETVQGLLK
jgi:UDP-N-acetylglucosamine 2-epimerase (non-hydrolysing)